MADALDIASIREELSLKRQALNDLETKCSGPTVDAWKQLIAGRIKELEKIVTASLSCDDSVGMNC